MDRHATSPRIPARRRLRRAILGVAAIACVAAGPIASGCAPGFDPISKVVGLRVFAVTADQPYSQPGESVTFKISYQDAPIDGSEGNRPVQILWLGGCFNPFGDQYYGCYPKFAELFADLGEGGSPLDNPYIGIGDTFTMKLPEDFISSHPIIPGATTPYGMAYVFFAACAGQIRPLPPGETADEGGAAGSFPLGCYDSDGNRLGPDSFVPGYTQVYAFEGGRENANPAISALTLADGDTGEEQTLSDDVAQAAVVTRCDVDEETRRAAACNKGENALAACKSYNLEAIVASDVAELDPGSKDVDGKELHEAVWLDYYADAGDLGASVKLVADTSGRYVDDRAVNWVPPDSPGPVNIYAVAHDSRGGASVIHRVVVVE